MQSTSRTISPFWYSLTISLSTNAIFAGAFLLGLALFIPRWNLDPTFRAILVFLILWKSLIVSIVIWFMHRHVRGTNEFWASFVGMYFGRFYGLFLGGFLGSRFAELVGLQPRLGWVTLIGGALAFYFAGRSAGARVGNAVRLQLEKVATLPMEPEVAPVKSGSRLTLVLTVSAIWLPVALVTLAALLKVFDVVPDPGWEDILIARAVVLATSVLFFAYPWLARHYARRKPASAVQASTTVMEILGASVSMVPLFLGFCSFLVMGLPLLVVGLIAAASSVSALLWLRRITLDRGPQSN